MVVESVNSGRATRGERWQFEEYSTETTFSMARVGQLEFQFAAAADTVSPQCHEGGGGDVWFTDRTTLDSGGRGGSNWGFDMGGMPRDAFASVRYRVHLADSCVLSAAEASTAVDFFHRPPTRHSLMPPLPSPVSQITAVGPRAVLVAERLEEIADAITIRAGARTAAAKNRAYRDDATVDVPDEAELPELSGTVLMSVSHLQRPGVGGGAINMPAHPPATAMTRATVARIVAETPEDITRIVAACLSPLEADFGIVPFEDRIYADAPKPSDGSGQQTPVDGGKPSTLSTSLNGPGPGLPLRQQLSADQMWCGNFDIILGLSGLFSSSMPPPHAVWCARLNTRAYWMMNWNWCACNPVPCPIHVVRTLMQLSDATLPTGGMIATSTCFLDHFSRTSQRHHPHAPCANALPSARASWVLIGACHSMLNHFCCAHFLHVFRVCAFRRP